MRRPSTATTASACLALVVCALATTLPWLSAGLGDEPRVFSGSDMAPLAWTVWLLCALTTAALLVAGYSGHRAARMLAIAGTAGVALLTAVLIGALETIAALLPDSLLPVTLRRLTIEVRAGDGLWLAFAAALVAFLAVLPWAHRRPRLLAGRIRARDVAPPLLLLVVTFAFTALRYEPWLEGGTAGMHLALEAWATPWVGPVSLAVVWMLVVSCVIALFGARWIAGLVAACAGWVMTFLASLAVVASATVDRIRIDELVPSEWRTYAPSFEAASWVWLVFATGLVAAVIGAALITGHRAPDPPTVESAWPNY